MFRVPLLLEKSLAMLYRLDVQATKLVRPYVGATAGYDDDFREPLVFDDVRGGKTTRQSARIELPPIRVPCQVETQRFERLDQKPPGDVPDSDVQLVFHRMDLLQLKLIDPYSNELAIKKNDRVSHIEAYRFPGKVSQQFEPPGLYITQIVPGSFGFGPDGFDLHIVYLGIREVVS